MAGVSRIRQEGEGMSLQAQHALLLAARLSLAVIFVVSALAKLADRRGQRRAISDFGIPEILTRPAGLVLAPVELTVAVALLPARSAWWAAIGTLGLLFLFTAAVVGTIARGRRPECHCFGTLSSRPVSWRTVVRNLALSALAAVVVAAGPGGVGPSGVAWVTSLTLADGIALAVGVLILVIVTIETWILVHVLRQNGRLMIRLDAIEADRTHGKPSSSAPGLAAGPRPPAGLATGSPAPAFRLEALDGTQRTLSELLLPGKPVALAFIDPGCGPCNALLPDLDRWQRENPSRVTLVLISRGSLAANRRNAGSNCIDHFFLDEQEATSRAYHADGTPSMVIVNADGTIASPVALGADAIRAVMVGFSTEQHAQMSGPAAGSNGHDHRRATGALTLRTPAIGQPAPTLRLPDLNGELTGLEAFGGTETLVLFWSPGCGFCQQMLGDLKRWEAGRAPDAVPLENRIRV
jgi:thiol-disulfide isomerase/thioredoxin